MANRVQLTNPQTDFGQLRPVQPTDWTKCILCQSATSEPLRCPAETTRSDKGAGYETLSENLLKFNELKELPIPVDISRLDDGPGVSLTLQKRQAKWHKSCYDKVNTTKLKRVEKRVSEKQTEEPTTTKKYTRLSEPRSSPSTIIDTCFFCEKSSSESLHNASTFGIDRRVRKCAMDLQDERLLAKLSAGDMVALEAKYHARCLAALYNKAAGHYGKDKLDNSDKTYEGIAFAELISYIDELRADGDKAPVLKLKDLCELYTSRIEQLGIEQNSKVHSSKLKDRILCQFPDMSAHREGRNVLLVFNKDIGLALRKAYESSYDADAICLAKAANIVRKDMLKIKSKFTGSFELGFQNSSVPQCLLALVGMILDGPSIKTQSSGISQAALSTAQLLQYNCNARHRARSTHIYHKTPLPIYIGLIIHAKTRRRDLVETLFHLGVSISYGRVMDITTALGNRVCEHYHRTQIVCPPNLRVNLFTTAAIDNIDHNPSSTSALGSFHGTGISLFQHPSRENDGVDRAGEFHVLQFSQAIRQVSELPDTYTVVHTVQLKKTDVSLPKLFGPVKGNGTAIMKGLEAETRWLKSVESTIMGTNPSSNISWAAYHASQLPRQELIPAISSLLLLFPDDSKSVPMIRHAMDVIWKAVQEVNPGQVPVITLDQPLYAIAKEIQWNWPDTHEENCFVIVLGGLHIEKASLQIIGDWLEDSGWVEALVQAKVASPGTADAFLKVSHITRARHAHQITASSLFILLRKAYNEYKEDTLAVSGSANTFRAWCTMRKDESPQFLYWYTALDLELLVLSYVRSLRESNFLMYTGSLTKIAPWFFSLDHINYARWLPIHVRDMASLRESHPNIDDEFCNGKFTVQITRRLFSAIAIDHAHEQNNAAVKGDGGAIGLTQNPDFLHRWTVSGPELARMISEFELSKIYSRTSDKETHHHEQSDSIQARFTLQVKAMVEVMEDMGNPFSEDRHDLFKLDTKEIADQAVVDAVCKAEKAGQDQYDAYVTERLCSNKPISDPIKKNRLPLFSRPPARKPSKTDLQVKSLKNDCSLFSRLYIACQTRDGDLHDFFKHENHAFPPSLSFHGNLRLGKKSDLLSCIENCGDTKLDIPETDVIILDGAVIVNMIRPTASKTFEDYALKVFVPYIKSQLQRASRVDIVWDQYLENSLKSQARQKRGKGIRIKVQGSTCLPTNWQQFLRVEENKSELFAFLADHVAQIATDKQLITTHRSKVLCTHQQDTSQLEPCTHEEADTGIILHTADAVRGFKKVTLRTVDTDVVVLAVSSVPQLDFSELWLAFGTGQHLRYIPAHEIATFLGPEKANSLPLFHAYTGCDTVSAFANRGKKSAWDTWKTYNEVTTAFLALSNAPQDISVENCALLERFTVLLYHRTSSQEDIDRARYEMFVQKGRTMEDIPPTKDALMQHIKRAVYQGGHCWGKALEVAPTMPSPSDWGWTNPDRWTPLWTTLPQANKSSRELLCCGCKMGCSGRCKCKKAAMKCTAPSHLNGDCDD